MLNWKLYRSERTLHLVIGNSWFDCHRRLSGMNTSLPPISGSLGNADVKSNDDKTGKLDIFVQRIKLNNPAKIPSSHQSSVRSRKLLKGRPEIPKIRQLVVERKESYGSARTNLETEVHDSVRSPTEPFLRDIKQDVCIKEKNYVESVINNKDIGAKTLDKSDIKSKKLESSFEGRNISLNVSSRESERCSETELKHKLSPPSNVFPESTLKSCTEGNSTLKSCTEGNSTLKSCTEGNSTLKSCTEGNSTLKSCTEGNNTTGQVKKSGLKSAVKPWEITEAEELMLTRLIDSGKVVEALAQIEDLKRQNRAVPFGLLRCFCGCACTHGLVKEINKVKEVAAKLHPHLYRKHMRFDNYVASAYCHSGNFSKSLEVLLSLYQEHNRGSKKLKDAVSLITYTILNSDREEDEQMVLRFVQDLAENKNTLHPALAVWRYCFCSSSYRHQRIAKTLVECYPELIEMLPQKLTTIISKSHIKADLDLMHRTFELLLQYKFTDFYAPATIALLHCQCEIGDVDGVNQTMKFALALKVFLKPSQIQQFLALLARRNKPAPLLLLEMKYKSAPRHVPDSPPEFKYKF